VAGSDPSRWLYVCALLGYVARPGVHQSYHQRFSYERETLYARGKTRVVAKAASSVLNSLSGSWHGGGGGGTVRWRGRWAGRGFCYLALPEHFADRLSLMDMRRGEHMKRHGVAKRSGQSAVTAIWRNGVA